MARVRDSGLYLDAQGMVSAYIEAAGALITSDADRLHEGFPTLIGMQKGYSGNGRITEMWELSPRNPAACQTAVRTD